MLYIQDDPDIRIISCMALEDICGFNALACANGRELLAAIQSFTQEWLLLNVMMPEMDGPTPATKVRQTPGMARVPLVFMTAQAQHHEMKDYRRCGARHVVAKPFDQRWRPTCAP